MRGVISKFNNGILQTGGYINKYNPNQTTIASTIITLAGVGMYVHGILSGNHPEAVAGMGTFAAGRYGDLLDGDHARELRKIGKWDTNTGAVFDADMDKVSIYSAVVGLGLTHSLPRDQVIVLGTLAATMFALDFVSYRLRSSERDWGKVGQSIIHSGWTDPNKPNTSNNLPEKLNANLFGKLKTLFQSLGIISIGASTVIDDTNISQTLQHLGAPFFLGAIGLASTSLWSKMRRN